MSSPFTLPSTFLTNKPPTPTKTLIDFAQTPVPEYAKDYAVIIDNALTKAECDLLVRAAEARTNGAWEQAMVNIGGGMQVIATDTRDCGRIIWDDADIVEKIWQRVKHLVPEIHTISQQPLVTGQGPAKRKETLQMTRLNERMRFLKYEEGNYFRPHWDGSFRVPGGDEFSLYTLHLYLNEADPSAPEGELKGGATTFHSCDERSQLDVDPKIGRILIFQHRNLLHSGADVHAGIKLTMRTDLMYRKIEKAELD
ncbi:MAG: hypothetical protein Q9195_003291 [Heterodermia aff. obscurata]